MNKCIWSHKSQLRTVKFVEQLRYQMRTWWHSNPTLKNQFQQMTMVEMDEESNNHVKLNNQEYSSVLLLLYFQGKINGPGTCWHYRAWGVSLDTLTCGLSPSDLVTCHLHIIVVVMTVAEMSSSTIRQTSKIKSCPHIYLVSLSRLFPCGFACNIILPVKKMSTTKIECW